MSEERTDPKPLSEERLLDNAKRISQYMRDTLEELKQILAGDPLTDPKEETPPAVTMTPPAAIETAEESAEEMLRAAGDRIDPPATEIPLGEFAGLPIIWRVPFIPGNNPFANGRDEPLPYVDPLENEDQDLVDDVLDCDVVALMARPPQDQDQDQIDIKIHDVESCPDCQVNYCKLCTHCLELKICKDVPVQRTTKAAEWPPDREGPAFAHLSLCRDCERDFKIDRGLLLEE